MPFQLMPVLEVDGKVRLCGHVNIARYIGEKYGKLNMLVMYTVAAVDASIHAPIIQLMQSTYLLV